MKTFQFVSKINWVNRYTVTIAVFAVWITFFDGKYNLLKQYKLTRQIHELEEQKKLYGVNLEKAKKEYDDLLSNREKFAREKYFISKEGEDVYIIE